MLYLLNISNIKHSKLGCYHKNDPSKKKDFIGYGNLLNGVLHSDFKFLLKNGSKEKKMTPF